MGQLLNRNFVQRTLSGVVLVVIVVGAIKLSPYTMLGLLCAICIGAMLEFYKLATYSGANPQDTYPTILGTLLVLLAFFVKLNQVPVLLFVAFIPLLFLILAIELYRKSEAPFANIAWSLLGILYIAVPLALLVYIPIQPATHGYLVYRPLMLLSIIFIIWANDVGAYVVGVLIGKHRLFERISPKKSWEGFFGGLLAAVGVGLWMSHLQGGPLWVWGVGAVVVSISGVYGDLIESMLKRSLNIKDSGSVIPGHGGFLDRFDALLFATPFVFAYLMFLL